MGPVIGCEQWSGMPPAFFGFDQLLSDVIQHDFCHTHSFIGQLPTWLVSLNGMLLCGPRLFLTLGPQTLFAVFEQGCPCCVARHGKRTVSGIPLTPTMNRKYFVTNLEKPGELDCSSLWCSGLGQRFFLRDRKLRMCNGGTGFEQVLHRSASLSVSTLSVC